MSEDVDPVDAIEAIDKAVQVWVQAKSDEPAVLTGWVLAYGVTTFKDDGEPLYRSSYATADGVDIARAVGLLEVAKATVMEIVMSDDE